MRALTRILFIIVWWVVGALYAIAQFDYKANTAAPPPFDGATPLTDELTGNTAPSSLTVCPSFFPGGSFSNIPSTRDFTITATPTADGAGTLADNVFIWVVYGGHITHIDGQTVADATTAGKYIASESSEQTVGTVTRHHAYILGDDGAGESTVTVEWDEAEVANGWVAIQQRSEWNCSDDLWSRYDINITSGNAPATASLTTIVESGGTYTVDCSFLISLRKP